MIAMNFGRDILTVMWVILQHSTLGQNLCDTLVNDENYSYSLQPQLYWCLVKISKCYHANT